MAKFKGRSVLLKVDTADLGGVSATWITIAQLRADSLQRGLSTADGTTKDDAGWDSPEPIGKNWSVSGDGILDPTDPAYLHILAKWRLETIIWVQIDASLVSGAKEEGKAIISSFTEEANHDGLMGFSLDLQGSGSLIVSP